MATTSIWSIKNNLKQSINYIINPEKTLNKDYGNRESYSYLEEPIKDYNFKQEKVCYDSGSFFIRKDYVFSSSRDTAGGSRYEAAHHWAG